MLKTRLIRNVALVLLSSFGPTWADESTLAVWDPTNKTMFDYVLDGYELKFKSDDIAVSMANAMRGVGVRLSFRHITVEYLLQKGTTIVKCFEIHDFLDYNRSTDFDSGCFVLARPKAPSDSPEPQPGNSLQEPPALKFE